MHRASAVRPVTRPGWPQPLFRIGGNLVATQTRGPLPHRVAVISIPKSGTYLLGALLAELGLEDTHLHVWETALSDYRNATHEEMVSDFRRREVRMPLARSLTLVQPGQFVVGHLLHMPENLVATAGFTRVFAFRNLRECLVSHMRFVCKPGRHDPEDLAWMERSDPRKRLVGFLQRHVRHLHRRWYQHQVGWLEDRETVPLRFEDLMNEADPGAREASFGALARSLGLPDAAAIEAALQRCRNRPSKTFSGERSSLAAYWSPAAERIFVRSGCADLNRRMGYEPQG
jgi:hypothetical protein